MTKLHLSRMFSLAKMLSHAKVMTLGVSCQVFHKLFPLQVEILLTIYFQHMLHIKMLCNDDYTNLFYYLVIKLTENCLYFQWSIYL